MRRWTESGLLVTRRMFERRLNEVFDTPSGERVMCHARSFGLISKGRNGPSHDRPLMPCERAVLILITALIAGTNLTLVQAARLVAERSDWVREAQAAALTGQDIVLRHTLNDSLSIEVTVRNAALRDPVIGVNADVTLEAA